MRDLVSNFLGTDSCWRLVVGHVGNTDAAFVRFSSDQSLPSIAALSNDLLGVFLVLAFAAEGKLVLGLAIWDLVDSEPFVTGSE